MWIIQMKVDVVETREFQVPMSRIRGWSDRLGLPKGEPIVATDRAERSISGESGDDNTNEDLSENIGNGNTRKPSENLFNSDTNSGKLRIMIHLK